MLATGDCAVPAVPWFAASAPAAVEQMHASRYRAPERLAPGGVLVVGAGPSGHQIADELARAGRRVVLAVGRHARIVRRYRGRDIWAWLDALGDLSRSLADELSSPCRRRPRPALPLDGRRGGRTLDLGVLAAAGVRITGRLEGFAGDARAARRPLEANIADADARLRPPARAHRRPHRLASRRGRVSAARAHRPAPPARRRRARSTSPAEGIATIVWATGHRRHFP